MPPASLPASVVMPPDDPDDVPELPLPEDDDPLPPEDDDPLLDPLAEPPLEPPVDPVDALPDEDPEDELLFCVGGEVVEQPTTTKKDAAIPSGTFLDVIEPPTARSGPARSRGLNSTRVLYARFNARSNANPLVRDLRVPVLATTGKVRSPLTKVASPCHLQRAAQCRSPAGVRR